MLATKIIISYKNPIRTAIIDFTDKFQFIKAYPKDGVLFLETCVLDPKYESGYSVINTRFIPLDNIFDFSMENISFNDISAHLMMQCPKTFVDFVQKEDLFDFFKNYTHKGYSMHFAFRRVNNVILTLSQFKGKEYNFILDLFMKKKFENIENLGLDTEENRNWIYKIDFEKTLFQEEYIEKFETLSADEQSEYVIFDISGKDSIMIVKKEYIVER